MIDIQIASKLAGIPGERALKKWVVAALPGPAEMTLNTESIDTITTRFNNTDTLRLLPRERIRNWKLQGLHDHPMVRHGMLHPRQGGESFRIHRKSRRLAFLLIQFLRHAECPSPIEGDAHRDFTPDRRLFFPQDDETPLRIDRHLRMVGEGSLGYVQFLFK